MKVTDPPFPPRPAPAPDPALPLTPPRAVILFPLGMVSTSVSPFSPGVLPPTPPRATILEVEFFNEVEDITLALHVFNKIS